MIRASERSMSSTAIDIQILFQKSLNYKEIKILLNILTIFKILKRDLRTINSNSIAFNKYFFETNLSA